MIEHETPVLVVGAGPAGLIAALQLARHGTRCMLVERNLDTTRWPKMDITNCRSMELLRRLGVADGLREVGVAQNYSFDVLFSTGLSEGGQLITKWDLPSPDDWRKRIRTQNDGSMPREPYQRCSQAIFEAWLKPRIQAEPLIDSHFGLKFESLAEYGSEVVCHLVDIASGEQHMVRCNYVIGCDGAGSRVRRAIGGTLTGGPIPWAMFLVHFKSKDLTRLHKQGQFWHIFFTSGSVIISQDEVDTWTAHLPISLDQDITSLDPEKAIQQVLGGSGPPYPLTIDEILVTSAWRPNICVVDRYQSAGGRVFLAGDSAHQNIPTGGYGMNSALGDSFDLGWKLAAKVQGYGGLSLLKSYEIERRPVAIRNIEQSGVHSSIHATYVDWVRQAENSTVTADLQRQIAEYVQQYDGENKDHGIEMGYRYNFSPIICADKSSLEPEWNRTDYVPSTWPGARAPHIFLTDGKTSVFDLFGNDYTFIDFSSRGRLIKEFALEAKKLNIPLKVVHLPKEKHARNIWGRESFLVRPDDHVAWRSPGDEVEEVVNAREVLLAVTGQQEAGVEPALASLDNETAWSVVEKHGFTATVGNVDQDKVEMLAAFQK